MTAPLPPEPEFRRFNGLLDLARLPYFDVRGGRLVLADAPARPDAALGPTIDVHTHLALTYLAVGRASNIDLRAAPRPAEHFLPAERTLDLEVYQNRNFTQADLAAMERELARLAICPVDCGGRRQTHTVPNLQREMAELGVLRSVLLPIDLPFLSRNAEAYLDATAGCGDLLCFGSIHPFAPNRRARLRGQVAAGIRGVKVHPAVQLVPPDHPKCMEVYAMCAEHRLPILFHCGPVDIETRLGRRFSQVARYERAVAENPDTVFLLGHSGALQLDAGLALAKRYPNVWLELASQGLSSVRRILEEGPTDRVVYGSDWPFYHQAIGLAKVFLATEGAPSLRKAVLSGNAIRLFSLDAPVSPACG